MHLCIVHAFFECIVTDKQAAHRMLLKLTTGLISLDKCCQNNQLMETLGYGPLVKNMDCIEELFFDLQASKLAKSAIRSRFAGCKLKDLTDLDLISLACDSKKTFRLEVRIAVRQEIIRLSDTLASTEVDSLETLESRLLESISLLPQVVSFLAKCKEAHCLEKFLIKENYFPNFDFSQQQSDFLRVTKCLKCGFNYDSNLNMVKKKDNGNEPSKVSNIR